MSSKGVIKTTNVTITRKKLHTPAWRLFHRKIPIYIPHIFLINRDIENDQGVPLSGDSIVDQHRINEVIMTHMTIAGIAMHIGSGYKFTHKCLIRRSDKYTIYEDIQDHFYTWLSQVNCHGTKSLFPPITDLRLLEQIAIELHPYAMKINPVRKSMAEVTNKLLEFNLRRNRAGTLLKAKIDSMDDKGVVKPYESIVDRIEEYLFEED